MNALEKAIGTAGTSTHTMVETMIVDVLRAPGRSTMGMDVMLDYKDCKCFDPWQGRRSGTLCAMGDWQARVVAHVQSNLSVTKG